MTQLHRVGWLKWAARPLTSPSSIHRHIKHPQGTASVGYWAFDNQELYPCTYHYFFRPVLAPARKSKHAVSGASASRYAQADPGIGRKIGESDDDWVEECFSTRLLDTGVNATYTVPEHFPHTQGDASRIDTDNPFWDHPVMLRKACKVGLRQGIPASVEIASRKLCAETKDPRFPWVYRTLETQAHVLYLMGRVELERAFTWRKLAHHMLLISAGLGQLDAALLLHQLNKVDKQLTVQEEQQAVIAKAAQDRLDWRAMVAHSEYLASQARPIPGRLSPRLVGHPGMSRIEQLARLDGPQLEECLNLLSEAMTLTQPLQSTVDDDDSPLPSQSTPQTQTKTIDVETLEVFDPPYKLLYNLTHAQLLINNPSPRIEELHKHALRTGALEYHDPIMAAHYVFRYASTNEHDKDWVECAELAAADLNADVCFHLALYHLKKEGWYPSLAARKLDDFKRKEREAMAGDPSLAQTFVKASEREKHDAIMARKDEKLREGQEGFRWMKIAAQLHLQSAGKMMNRYCIIAGLLRQNGFMSDGRAMLLEAKAEVNECVGEVRDTNKALRILDEYIDYWDSRLVHHLLTPKDITGLVEGAQKV